MITWLSLESYCTDFSRYTRLVVGDGTRIRFWEGLWCGDQLLCSKFLGLFRIVIVKNLTISLVLGSTNPFSWNINFHQNVLDFGIEDLERLISSLSHLHLSSSGLYLRAWSLSFSGLFTVMFFSVLSNHIDPNPSFPIDFAWKSQASFKVKSFAWLVALKKVNTNDILQLRRSYKAFSSDVCLFVVYGECNDGSYLLISSIEFGAMA